VVLELEVRNTLSLPTTRYEVCKRAAWTKSVCLLLFTGWLTAHALRCLLASGKVWGYEGVEDLVAMELLCSSSCFSLVHSAFIPPSECISGQKCMVAFFFPSSLLLSRISVIQT